MQFQGHDYGAGEGCFSVQTWPSAICRESVSKVLTVGLDTVVGAGRNGSMEKIVLFFKGMAMGAADVVPGVSGGTIAFVTGIYEELVRSLAAFQLGHLKLPLLFLKGSSARADRELIYQELNIKFLITLGAGIFFSIVSLAKIIPHFMENYPFETYSLFFGLILFSIAVPYQKIKEKNLRSLGVFVFVALISGLFFLKAPDFSFPQNALGVFLGGMIAICAMILPGISGSYLLLIMGLYRFVLEALHERNFAIVVPFALGCGIGILSFVKFLQWLLSKHRDFSFAALSGLMLGSLTKIWPAPFYDTSTSSLPLGIGMCLVGAIVMIAMVRLDPEFKAKES